jgi:2-iminobutanoate/2-iminopropanoate deaminase
LFAPNVSVMYAHPTLPPAPRHQAPAALLRHPRRRSAVCLRHPRFDAYGGLPDTYEAQFANVVTNIKCVLTEASAIMRDVVNVLLTRASDVATMNALYAGAFRPAPYPARTTCVVQALWERHLSRMP